MQFMMQMSYAGMKIWNVLWCKCFLMGMSWCKCNLVGMQWYRCPFRYAMNANALLWVYHDTNALMQTRFIQKIPFIFQNETSSAPETKIFSKLDLLFLKSHLPFDLRLPKNWWSLLENLRMGHLLRIWWSGSKDLLSQFS